MPWQMSTEMSGIMSGIMSLEKCPMMSQILLQTMSGKISIITQNKYDRTKHEKPRKI